LILPIASINHSCQTAWLVGQGSGSPRSLMAWKIALTFQVIVIIFISIECHTSIMKTGKLFVEKSNNAFSNKQIPRTRREQTGSIPLFPTQILVMSPKGLLFYSPSFDSTFFATHIDQY
jgi:hypothetical protein